jgi:hypothetical protein
MLTISLNLTSKFSLLADFSRADKFSGHREVKTISSGNFPDEVVCGGHGSESREPQLHFRHLTLKKLAPAPKHNSMIFPDLGVDRITSKASRSFRVWFTEFKLL